MRPRRGRLEARVDPELDECPEGGECRVVKGFLVVFEWWGCLWDLVDEREEGVELDGEVCVGGIGWGTWRPGGRTGIGSGEVELVVVVREWGVSEVGIVGWICCGFGKQSVKRSIRPI